MFVSIVIVFKLSSHIKVWNIMYNQKLKIVIDIVF